MTSMDFSFCQMNKRSMDHTYGFRACLYKGGGPQVGEVTCGGLPHLTCKRDQIKMKIMKLYGQAGYPT